MLQNNAELSEEEFLAQYDAARYPKPSVTVDVVAFRNVNGIRQVLLVKRGNHPCKGAWALPGGFLNLDEELDTAAKRELKEETGLDITAIEEIGVYGAIGRDKRDRVITVAFAAEVSGVPISGDDAAECAWFELKWWKIKDVLGMELKNGQEVLKADVLLGYAPLSGRLKVQKIVESDLAFDHGLILADGLFCVGKGVE